MFENKDNKLIILITKLLKETKNNDLHWHSKSAPKYLTEGTDNIIHNYFYTDYKGKQLALFHRKFRQYSGEFDTLYWTGETKLAIIESDIVLWENNEYIPAINDLYNYVSRKASGLNDLLDELV